MTSPEFLIIGAVALLLIVLGRISFALTREIFQRYEFQNSLGAEGGVNRGQGPGIESGRMTDAKKLIVAVVAWGLVSLGTSGVAAAQQETAPRLELDAIAERLQLSQEQTRELAPYLERFADALRRGWSGWRQDVQMQQDLSEAYQHIAQRLTTAQLWEFQWILREATYGPGFGQPYGRMMMGRGGGYGAWGGPLAGMWADSVLGPPRGGMWADSVWGGPWGGLRVNPAWSPPRWGMWGGRGWRSSRRGMWGGRGWRAPGRGLSGGWGSGMGLPVAPPGWRPDDTDPGV